MKILSIGDSHGDMKKIKKIPTKNIDLLDIHEGEGKAKIGQTLVYNLGVAGHRIINL